MVHLSEESRKLKIKSFKIDDFNSLESCNPIESDVYIFVLPFYSDNFSENQKLSIDLDPINEFIQRLKDSATIIIIGESSELANIASNIEILNYHHWIVIERKKKISQGKSKLPIGHFGALVYTKYQGSLKHTKTRIEYSYCPTCDKTTKDYGGKKHTYHHFGTLISDVWRDINVDPDQNINIVIDRFADLFGTDERKYMSVIYLNCLAKFNSKIKYQNKQENIFPSIITNTIIEGDVLVKLRKIPDNSVDYIFTDPPYNLKKKYQGYSDDLSIKEYFDWCDSWLTELVRILKPGRTLSLLNIPLWSIRHYIHLSKLMEFQNWIVWDALAFPVRKIMPAHYSIISFSKGTPRELPGLKGEAGITKVISAPKSFNALQPMVNGYCYRASCVKFRKISGVDDRESISDLWSDIHRLKHNSRRVDHPTQLPPHLMYRLYSVFSKPNEIVLDCFNGAGTSTLAAHQLERRFCGIELEKKYVAIGLERHMEINNGIDPFRKKKRNLVSKNSPVPRIKKQKYKIPKKTLQLEVKRVSHSLGHIPNREELIRFGSYPIEYYDNYFLSWGEVTAAARTTGMSEDRNGDLKTIPVKVNPQLKMDI